MKTTTRMILAAMTVLALTGLLLSALGSAASPGVSGRVLQTATPTATICPTLTPEPFGVLPVTSPTRLFSQDVRVFLGNCDVVTVTAESGVFTAGEHCSYLNPARVRVALLPNATHHLEVRGKVRQFDFFGSTCGGYSLGTTTDIYGSPLVITQVFTPVVVSYLPLIHRGYQQPVR